MGQETAEKQAPSALDFVGHFGKALQSEIDSGKKLPMSQAIGQLVSAYNAKIKVKRWRVDSAKKRIVLNLLRCPSEVTELLAKHYDQHRHAVSGWACFSYYAVSESLFSLVLTVLNLMPTIRLVPAIRGFVLQLRLFASVPFFATS